MDGQEQRERNRKRFLAAIALFCLWVVVLGVMAVKTGRRPVARPVAIDGP